MSDASEKLDYKALVVDDNGLVAMDTREILIEMGLDEVDIASHGDEAIERLDADRYDWALVDGTLKGGNLDHVIAALDANAVPLIFICSQPDGSDIAADREGRPFLSRPYAKRDLAALIGLKG